MYNKTFRRAAIVSAITAAATTGAVNSQSLEEVIVTAQHRAENLVDVPIAITAIGAEDLRAGDISDLTAVSQRTPGFSMGTFNPAQPQLFIRGVGSNADGAAEDQSVVVFLDGVYLGRTAGQAFDLFDLERIEVLRGPQGTLYGKNAAGGAINVVSQKPTQERSGAIELSAGDLGYQAIRGKINGALSDTLAGKLAFSRKERDGYVKSIAPNTNLDDFNSYETTAVRGQLLATLSDELDVLFSADYSDDSRVAPGRNVGTQFLQSTIVRNYFDPGFYENVLTSEPHSEIENWGVSVQADWQLGEGTLTSITAYRETDADVLDVAFAAAYQYLGLGSLDNYFVETSEQLTQELRYSIDINDQLFLQSGIFYLNEQVQREETQDIVCGLLCAGYGATLAAPIPLFANADQSNETDSYGLFMQANYKLTERLDITVGGRYTYEEKHATNVGTPDGAFSILQGYDVKMNESWSAFTPKVAVSYAFNDDVTGYATVSTGFKSGGYQGMAPNRAAASTPFDEETVTNFELGLKGTAFDNTVRFSASAFQSQFDAMQVLILTVQPSGLPGPQLTANAGEAEIQGVELETQWQINEYLQLAGSYAYLDTEYSSLDNDLAIHEGNKLRNAPRGAGSLSAILDYPLSQGSINARLDYSHKGIAYQDIANEPAAAIPAYDLLNARVAYLTADGQWELAGWVKNLTDEEYLLHNSVLNPGLAQLSLPAAPRTWGVTVTYQFGE